MICTQKRLSFGCISKSPFALFLLNSFGFSKVAERDPVEPRQKRLFSVLLTESLLAILSMAASSLSQNHLKISVFGACNFRRANLGLIKAKKRRQL